MASQINSASTRRMRRNERILQTNRALRQAKRRQGRARQELLNQAIELNVPVARSIAHQFHNRGESSDDLDQVAYLGLVKAVNGFDPEKGDEFLAYAVPTITGEVKRYFRDAAWAVRPPRRIQDLQGEITPAVEELSQLLGRSPRSAEIADHLGREEEEIVEALACGGCFTPTSIDDRGPGGDGYQVAERLGEDDRGFGRAEAVVTLQEACRQLKPRDRRILYLRFFKDWTQEQIAQELGVTQMQVSRLLARIMRNLRDSIEGTHTPAASRQQAQPAQLAG
jgi:RNA polymerase sigma-B factor